MTERAAAPWLLAPGAAALTRRGALALLTAAWHGGMAAAASPPRRHAPWFADGSPQAGGAARGALAAAHAEGFEDHAGPDHGAGPTSPAARRLLQWTEATLGLVVKYQQNPLRAARALAYLQVALHDGWLRSLREGLVAASAVQAELAAHRAASLVLAQLYPHETPGRFEAGFAANAASLGASAGAQRQAEAAGRETAGALIGRSLADGSGRVWSPRLRPEDRPGLWQPTWPLYAANPTEGLAGSWRPWLAPAPTRYDPPPAHRPGSDAHRHEALEVLAVARQLTPQQARWAHEWNLDAGSVTPPGLWMQIALRELAPAEGEGPAGAPPRAVRATAALAVAMHDALVDCWRVKMRDWSERPITTLRRELEPGFEPLLVTPGFPGYVSGHASVSAAAATVLAHFVPARGAAFEEMAQQAAQSRLWGGIHFRSDNDEGLRLGSAVGQEVVARAGPR